MFASRRAVSVASRRLSCRSARSIAPPARFSYSTESTAPSTSTPPAAAAEEKAKPAASTTTTPPPPSPPPTTNSAAPKPKLKPAAAAAASSGPQLSHSDVVFRPGPIGYEQVPETSIAEGAEGQASTDINWTTSFHGISTKPVSEKQFRMLMEPLNEKDIEVKPDGVIYLPEIKYRRKLNEIFGQMGWGLVPRGEAVVGESIVTREFALIIGGRFVSQAQGENSFFNADQLPSAVEGCKSNALMRCCKDLGIGSELWDPHFVRWYRKNHMEEVWVEHAVTKKKRLMWYKKGAVEVAYPYKISK